MTRRTRRSRRSRAVSWRARPHVPVDDPDAPGCCQICGLRTDLRLRNQLHIDPPPVDPEITAAEHRRLGETGDD